MSLSRILAALALACTATAGFLTSQALSIGSQQAQRTVTVNVATGPQGERGPAGPQGERGPPGPKGDPGAGGLTCPAGFTEGELVINHPGGHVTLFTCLHD